METTSFANNIVCQLLNIAMQFTIAFVPLMIGVYVKEYHEIMLRKKRKIQVKNIIVTTLTLSIVFMSIVPTIITSYGLGFSISGLFLVGVSSKKFTEMIFNGSLLKMVLKFVGKTKGNIQSSIQETLSEDEDDTKKKNNNTKKEEDK